MTSMLSHIVSSTDKCVTTLRLMLKRHRKDEEILERLRLVQAMFLTGQLGCPLVITGPHMVAQCKKAAEEIQKPEEKAAEENQKPEEKVPQADEADKMETEQKEVESDKKSQSAGKESIVKKDGTDMKTFEKVDRNPDSE